MKRLVMHDAGTAAFTKDDIEDKLEEHFGAKTWSVHGTTFGLEYLVEVYRRVESGRVVGGAANATEMRREDRALQILRKNGFIEYISRKVGWKTAKAGGEQRWRA